MLYEETTNPQDAGAANQPPAQDGSGEIGEDTLIVVDHPDFADQEDGEATPPAGNGGDQTPAGDGGQEQAAQDGGDQAPGQEGHPYMTIRHNGRDIPIKSQEDAVALAQMGLDYRYKTARLAPFADLIRVAAPHLADPARREQLLSYLNGQAPAQGDTTPDRAGAAQDQPAGQGELPPVYLRDPRTGEVARDESGNPILADRSFTLAVMDTIKAMGLDQRQERPPESQRQGRGYDPMVAQLVQRELIGQFANHAKATYQVEDLAPVLPMIKEELLAMGVRPPAYDGQGNLVEDPNDNPRMWDMALARLIATGKVKPGQAPATQKKRPDNKSQLKEQGRIPNQNAKPTPGMDREKAMERALKTGSEDDFVAVVEGIISHPAFEES